MIRLYVHARVGRRRLRSAAAVLAASLALALPAGARADAWSAEVAVAGRAVEEQREAYALAMRAVLLANAGDKTLLNRDDVRAALGEAERYVTRFGYRRPEPGTLIGAGTPLTEAVRESGEATQLMRVRFDRERLEALIRREIAEGATGDGADEASPPGDPLAELDSALVWLLIEDGRREILVDDPAAANVRARAREIAGASGISLVYPNGDEEDRAALEAGDIRAGRLDRVRAASLRYAPEVVLVGHLERDGLDTWQGQWLKLAGDEDGRVARERFASESLDAALEAGIGWLVPPGRAGDDRYRYGGEARSDTEALVWIGSLDSLDAYAGVMSFLAGVDGVATVYPKEIDARGMTFAVIPRGALPAIASAAASRSWLRRTTPPPEPPGPSSDGTSGGRTGDDPDASGGSDPRFGAQAPSMEGAPSAAFDPTGSARPAPRALASNAELAFDYLR